MRRLRVGLARLRLYLLLSLAALVACSNDDAGDPTGAGGDAGVDRGGRELPIAADHVALDLSKPAKELAAGQTVPTATAR